MSPVAKLSAQEPMRFPRVSGDEPYTYPHIRTQGVFSPRERG